MKPAAFDYYRPATVEDAVTALGSQEDAAALAGGQSLMPMLNMRLARPSLLVDLAPLALRSIEVTEEHISVDALVTHRELETDSVIRRYLPLVSKCARFIGHRAIRQRGTIGGSVSHADPTAELSLVTVTLGASMKVHGSAGVRHISADEFFLGSFTTALDTGDVVLGLEFPRRSVDLKYGFAEYARRAGDFAEASAACVIGSDAQDSMLVVTGAGSTPRSLSSPFRELSSSNQSAQRVAELVVESIGTETLAGDIDYRRQLLTAVVCDALTDAGWLFEGGTDES